MTKWLAGALVALLLGVAIAAEPPLKAGSVLHRTSKKHGHPWSLYVPSSYSPRASMPLVLSSHGRGGAGKKEINSGSATPRSTGSSWPARTCAPPR